MELPDDIPEDLIAAAKDVVFDFDCDCDWMHDGRERGDRQEREAVMIVAKRLLAERLSATEKLRDPPIEALQAMWEAMFTEPWDGTQAVMMGAGFDAAVAAIRSQP